MHQKNIHKAGDQSGSATRALIMVHGRGASAEDILSLAAHLDVKGYALFAPQATNHTWYPLSFLSPPAANEPWLSSALDILKGLVADIEDAGISHNKIYFAGFSQGACLTLEFVARNAKEYGGVAAFTGGLIGDQVNESNYTGDFKSTPIFIGSSDPDPHVPVERVHLSAAVLKKMNAAVIEKIYPRMGHTIIADEIEMANKHCFQSY